MGPDVILDRKKRSWYLKYALRPNLAYSVRSVSQPVLQDLSRYIYSIVVRLARCGCEAAVELPDLMAQL